jgi:hypothetical protein
VKETHLLLLLLATAFFLEGRDESKRAGNTGNEPPCSFQQVSDLFELRDGRHIQAIQPPDGMCIHAQKGLREDASPHGHTVAVLRSQL